MRLWSLHPEHLDARGLVALWREALLAQAVLAGRTRGYTRHPQLERFRAAPSPVGLLAEYLRGVHAESLVRGYRFDAGKIDPETDPGKITVTRGQLAYEWEHLLRKVERRDPAWFERLHGVDSPRAHPVMRIVAGGIEAWERVGGTEGRKEPSRGSKEVGP